MPLLAHRPSLRQGGGVLAGLGAVLLLSALPTALSASATRSAPAITAALIQACGLQNWEASVRMKGGGIAVDRSPTLPAGKAQCVDRFVERTNASAR